MKVRKSGELRCWIWRVKSCLGSYVRTQSRRPGIDLDANAEEAAVRQ